MKKLKSVKACKHEWRRYILKRITDVNERGLERTELWSCCCFNCGKLEDRLFRVKFGKYVDINEQNS